jgi:hypothetical protein
MRILFKVLTALSFTILSNSSMATECDEVCQLEQVKAYFSALDKVAKKGSAPSDIDALLDLTHSEVVK